MFVDEAKICLVSGRGGDGLISFHRDRFRRQGVPDGGDGGDGGDVILRASSRVTSLLKCTQQIHWKAESGQHGGPNRRRGRNGKDLIVDVPVGTVAKDLRSEAFLADFSGTGQKAVLARGGKGGRGNPHFRSPRRRAPHIRERGEPGEERWTILELKLLADVGLIGYPNAGKSTLLSAISSKRPKVAAYPFTTLEPLRGLVEVGEERSFVAVDIPGLIEGAHQGKGLGDRFLRHVERTSLLVHLVDISAWEGRDPVEDYRVINDELASYGPTLAAKPQIVVGNKVDLIGREGIEEVQERFRRLDVELLPLSAAKGEGLGDLVYRCQQELDTLEQEDVRPRAAAKGGAGRRVYRPEPRQPEAEEFTVVRDEEGLHVHGPAAERLGRLSLDEPDALEYLQEELERLGIFRALKREAIQDGDKVLIGDIEFEYRSEG